MCIAIAADLLCAVSTNIQFFSLARFFQAFGAASAAVICLALIADKFPENNRDRYISLMFMANIFSPMFGPTIGGYLAAAFCTVIFVCLAAYHAVLLLVTQILVRHGDELEAVNDSFLSFFRTAVQILNDKRFVFLMIATTLVYLVPFEWVVFSPRIILHVFNVSVQDYAPYFYVPALGFTLGTIVNIIIRRWHSAKVGRYLIPVAIVLVAADALFMYRLSAMGGPIPPRLVVELITFCFFCIGIAQPLLTNLAISCHSELALKQSGMVCCLQAWWLRVPGCLPCSIIVADVKP